jgi:5-hydroxyisourate hydrolase
VTEISSHVLDTAAGHPAAGVPISLHARRADGGWAQLGSAVTDQDGRAVGLAGASGATPGIHRLVFDTTAYLGSDAFFPEVTVAFQVDGDEHLHVPLLLNPYGYSIYKGS